ncbi:MAG: TerC family protein [Myxococcaceae bacterium]|jgi:predicted tellurium resistance membrane protein TerC|nr:TerC family protein [Myxococcaceae bacterium]MCA3015482.1 TerC family protein [Myxococcaceae bacterium]
MSLFSTEALAALVSLTAMEVVLGIDNIVFISIIAARLPVADRQKIVRLGIVAALVLRIGLLSMLSWLMGLTAPLVTVLGNELTGRDLILLGGGLFLIFKATRELYVKVEGHEEEDARAAEAAGDPAQRRKGVASVVLQILAIDLIFSLDSIITAVGMAQALWVMVVAMVIAVLTMMMFANAVGGFVERHPSVKVLALSFLLMIGTMLVADGLGTHVPKGYVYFAMAFSLGVELLNLRRATKTVKAEPTNR